MIGLPQKGKSMEKPKQTTQEVRKKLLTSAKKEFLASGFEKASLRRICRNAGVTTGAVYFFFQNKEELFVRIVEDTAREFIRLQHELSEAELAEPSLGVSCDTRFMEFLFQHKEETLLLLEKSRGTRYETFTDELYSCMGSTFLFFFQRYGRADIDPELIRILVEMRIKGFMAILKGDYTMKQVLNLTRQVGIYADGGFRQLTASLKTELMHKES